MMWPGPRPGPWPVGPEPNRIPVPTADRVLSTTRHPSFTPDMAVRVVHTLSWHDLQQVWASSTRALAEASQPGRLALVILRDELLREMLALVILRDELLREMEARDPGAFVAWYPGLGRRRRTSRRSMSAALRRVFR